MDINWDLLTNECVFNVEEVLFAKQKLVGRPEIYNIRVNKLTACLEFLHLQSSKIIFTVDLLDVKQVRNNQKCRESMVYLKYPFENHQFALLYGKQFVLKCLLLKGVDKTLYDGWITGLQRAIEYFKNSTYIAYLNRFLYKQHILIKDTLENRNLKDTVGKLKLWFERNNYRFQSSSDLNKLFDTYQHLQSLPLTFDKFAEIYEHVVLDSMASLTYNIFRSYFVGNQLYYSYGQRNADAQLEETFLRKWLIDHQLDADYSEAKINAIVLSILSKYSDNNLSLSKKSFLLYLLSKDNSIFDVEKAENIYQDMNRPLPHYWISCSHNTYLTGNQFTSDSSVECYIRAIQLGCRCIEIDVWNGSDNSIVVTHGLTRCGQIDLKDVLHGINAYAFEYSNFPLIISIENHCNLENQRKMAAEFRSIFGNKLITDFLNPNERSFPSPSELAGRIILKNVKNPSRAAGNYETRKAIFRTTVDIEEDNAQEVEIWNEEEKKYEKYITRIENMQLYYWKLVETEELLYQNIFDSRLSDIIEADYMIESENDAEPWVMENFTRENSEFVLTYYKECFKTGTFLIRQSQTSPSDYTLCVLYLEEDLEDEKQSSKIFFIKIKSFYRNNERLYTIHENNEFPSLSKLVDYYREHALEINNEIYLGFGVYKRTVYINEDWYMPEITRYSGTELLMRYKYNGSFLIRASEARNTPNEDGEVHTYTLSFYTNGTVYYAKIYVKTTIDFQISYFINNKEFQSLKSLVEYHKEMPVYKQQTLTRGIKSFHEEALTTPQSSSASIRSNNSYVLSRSQQGSLLPLQDSRETDLCLASDMSYIDIASLNLNYTYNEQTQKCEFMINGRDDKKEVRLQGRGNIDAYNSVILKIELLRQATMATSNISTVAPATLVTATESLHQEFSDLICYAQSVSFTIENPFGKYYEISSFAEPKKLTQNTQSIKFLKKRHINQLSRVYPKGLRVDSSNYDPVSFWAHGFQLIALNYQTSDKPMQINQAKFLDNGGCGYVLRPNYMLDENLDPTTRSNMHRVSITPIFAHSLPKIKDDGKSTSPLVEIEVITHDPDGLNRGFKKFRTDQSKANGLFAIYFRKPIIARFDIANMECAFLRFSIFESDVIGSDILLAQATYPLSCVQKGYRSVSLKNVFNDDLELSTLLVSVNIEPFTHAS